MTEPVFSRRRLLGGASVAALALGGAGLSACTTGRATTKVPTSKTSVTLPSYLPYTGVTPDFPSTAQGVDPAFRNFPQERPISVPDKPGSGQTVTGMANIFFAIPPGPDKNSYWTGLNERMGIDLKLQMVPADDYPQKFATTIASNDLPDVMQMTIVPNFPALLERRFARLDDFLAGEAIRDYPNLANLPTHTWSAAIYNGGIYGIPIPRGLIGSYNFIRQDLFEAAGLSLAPQGYDELIETGKALTDPAKRRWAYAMIHQPRVLLGRMNGEPNTWREEGGKLTSTYETEEYQQTINDLIALWKSGVVHPDAFSGNQPFKQLFNSGTTAIAPSEGYQAWNQYVVTNANNPDFKLGLMPIYTRDGSALARWALGPGVYAPLGPPTITALKKQDDPERIKLILRMLNYLAAPFGTAEYLYRWYGTEGVDHTVNADGDPVLTQSGLANTVLPIRFLADAPTAIFQPGRPQDAEVQHKFQSLEVPTGIQDPTLPLYSDTYSTKNASIDAAFNDGVDQIIQGRRPLSGFADLVRTWRSSGGDKIRQEFEESLQATGATPG